MIDRRKPIALAAATLALIVMSTSAGCKNDGEAGDESTSNGQTTQPADTGEAGEIDVPTQDEADAAAADLINEENADDMFEQLQEEIDGEEATTEDDGAGG